MIAAIVSVQKRTYPPRLREVRAAEEESIRRRGKRRTRWAFFLLAPILLALILVLGYGLIERNVLRPQVDPTVDRPNMQVLADEHIQVNVLNACGVDGVAKEFTEFLRARKFDVPEYGNAAHAESRSRVIDRLGDSLSALKVAYALGISPRQVSTEVDSSLYLRATVIIGADYRTLRPMR